MVSELVEITFVTEAGERIASKMAQRPNVPEEMEEGGIFPFVIDFGLRYQVGQSVEVEGMRYKIKAFLSNKTEEQAIYFEPIGEQT